MQSIANGDYLNAKWRGLLYVTLSAVLYGLLGFLGTKLLAADFSVANMLFWRFFIALLWIGCLLVIFERSVLMQITRIRLSYKNISYAILCYSASSFFYFLASQEIGTGIAMVVFFSYPVFVFLFSWLFSNWAWSIVNVTAMSLLCVGLFFLKGSGVHSITWSGLIYASLAALSYAIYVYASQYNPKSISTLMMTCFVCLGNSIIFFLYALLSHSLTMPQNISGWGYALGIGILATAIPIQLLLEGLKVITPIKVSILSVFEPVVTVLIGVYLLHESMSQAQALGIMIVLVAALLIQFDRISET